jgi:2-desacetyl-2-hydroxyethyl bacteriochlorophyllide A dehydrogenase
MGEGEVLVRVKRVGVCGTDMHAFGGRQPFFSYPRIMGHEVAGVVESAPATSALRAGDPVYIVPYLACGKCKACANGKPNCCMKLEVLGVHRDGAFAEFISVPAGAVFPAAGISLDDAAMLEFLAIGAHAVRRGEVRAGQRVVVSGAGPIGTACAIFAELAGAEVTVLDVRADRLLMCRKGLRGAHTHLVGPQIHELMRQLTRGDMFDVVFDATGNPASMESGFQFVGHGGTYVLVSVVDARIAFSDPDFHKREATLKASRNATAEDFARVHQCVVDGRIPTAALRTHHAPLSELPVMMPEWIRPESKVMKAIVEC